MVSRDFVFHLGGPVRFSWELGLLLLAVVQNDATVVKFAILQLKLVYESTSKHKFVIPMHAV